ncbi:hypothetical protein CAPTEDRAFT_187932 [Capitella teleta]|uniref:Uncharacterized protein n=1 Tax=Capitella teleta TaxID=283909 RepID=R7UCW8_CAPTE|nr:hypothetical protein CAPTEDRAFT_187932 [Capitella teleta]|eukprot:ELU01107.1 hypothetical protein CAPTEDRAFT_187932 [Capitella teleta]
MFITVRFGDNRSEIFNPDCPCRVLLNAIKSKCECDQNDVIDLSNESGVVKQLLKNPDHNGLNVFTNREELILLRVHRTQSKDAEGVTYTPLLQEKLRDQEFVAKLNRQFTKKQEATKLNGGRRTSMAKRKVMTSKANK